MAEVTRLQHPNFGQVAFVAVGATLVGSVQLLKEAGVRQCPMGCMTMCQDVSSTKQLCHCSMEFRMQHASVGLSLAAFSIRSLYRLYLFNNVFKNTVFCILLLYTIVFIII